MPFHFGDPRGIRTPDPRLRRPLLYPTELLDPMERAMGIEPTTSAWKAGVLPLNYARIFLPAAARLTAGAPNFVVGAAGFEPATPCSQGRCSANLSHAPNNSVIISVFRRQVKTRGLLKCRKSPSLPRFFVYARRTYIQTASSAKAAAFLQSVGENGVGDDRLSQICFIKRSTAEVRLVQPGLPQVGPAQTSFAQICLL